jgi:hypothetical protein
MTIDDIDAGGGDGSGLAMLPPVRVNWFGERQACPAVLACVHDDVLPDLASCEQYHSGRYAPGGGPVYTTKTRTPTSGKRQPTGGCCQAGV